MAEGAAGPDGRVVSAGQGSPGFEWPPVEPWSVIGEDFIDAWGHDEKGKLRAEHWEVEGQSGSGKSYLIATVMQQRAQRWDTTTIGIVTKSTDDSLPLLGWPIVGDTKELQQFRQCLFWPKTKAQGQEREVFHEQAIYALLTWLWPDPGETADLVVYMDEIRYLESLSPRLKKLIRMYWREGRSHGISIIAGAQRPLEMVRDMHSEARWKSVFKPADEADMERFAQLLGPHRDWEPVLHSLDQELHQFVLKNTFTKDAFITWIDHELRAVASQSAEGQKRRNRGRDRREPERSHRPRAA